MTSRMSFTRPTAPGDDAVGPYGGQTLSSTPRPKDSSCQDGHGSLGLSFPVGRSLRTGPLNHRQGCPMLPVLGAPSSFHVLVASVPQSFHVFVGSAPILSTC